MNTQIWAKEKGLGTEIKRFGMETKTIIYNEVKLMCFYTLLPGEKEETETNFSGKIEWRQLERVLVGGVDISNLLESEWEHIEFELNK